jgi:hypothetical protein
VISFDCAGLGKLTRSLILENVRREKPRFIVMARKVSPYAYVS